MRLNRRTIPMKWLAVKTTEYNNLTGKVETHTHN